jgi:1,4-dihydroxy-2-naphthoate octaprenyltransferase
LFCSHFHQRETDAAAGKRSPIVRLGTARAAAALSYAVALTHAGAAAAVGAGALPVHAAAALGLAMPAAKKLMEFVAETHDDPSRVFRAKFFAVRWHAALGMLLTIAFAVARVVR